MAGTQYANHTSDIMKNYNMKYILAYDLGTGGVKASLFNQNGESIFNSFISYETYYPSDGFHEQNPYDWWKSIVESTNIILLKHGDYKKDIIAISLSGHSLGAVPIDRDGNLLLENIPIWSDTRAKTQSREFFKIIDKDSWYLTTGNGFPSHLYSVFKQMWYKDNMPDIYNQTYKFIGTKDYINYKLTGKIYTDHSYASGSGVYDLLNWSYKDEYITASGVSKEKFPEILASTDVIGTLNDHSAHALGLHKEVKVVCGGVDNACMALGAGCIKNGMAYTSLGSSAWLTVSGTEPIVDIKYKPYVFTHCIPNMYISATSIFSAGSSFRWLKENVCKNLVNIEDVYEAMNRLASKSPIGAKKLFFNPSLAGGSSQDKSPNIRGGFVGLKLEHTQEDLIRATLEGICMNLKVALEILERYIKLSDDMLIVGGGGKSRFWRELFADIYDKNIIETNICEDAGSLGAFAIAAVGTGLWENVQRISQVLVVENKISPNKNNSLKYKKIIMVFKKISEMLSDIGDIIEEIDW